MRLRRSSIRARIIALLMVPIVALSGLWVYATLVTTGDAWSQLELSDTYKAFGDPADQYAEDLQAERLAAVLRLADPGSGPAAEAYKQAQTVTDRDLQLLRYLANGSDAGKLDPEQRVRLQDLLALGEQLNAIRSQVGQGREAWDYALKDYSDLIQPVFSFRAAFVSKQTGKLPRQGTLLIELARAREYLAREAAAMRGLRTGPMDERKVQVALDSMHSQQALFRIYVAELDQRDKQAYDNLRTSVAWTVLTSSERAFEDSADRAREVRSSSEDPWHSTADRVLDDLSALNDRLASAIGERARAYAVNALVQGGIAGVVGLGAVVLSILISFRIGRGLARELVGLRNAALDLSGTRLPSVMLRLRRGEPVDVASEVPELDFGSAEIGQVGRAFNDVQRAAVGAVVEQAELRRGVAAVFVNLARRSQVLLHRQLTLLDTMERRTEDPRELEDLFRLDHLTTRMRRHAEGLIILSGGSPGRAWRKPVRMVDVVRAAVGEVEDYARVIVRPFPGTGLLGSSVADVTHLIAELVENATVYSPPQTQVTVQGEVVAHGFCLEIDDRGLGLSEQALEEINQRLAVEQEFDLADTDRLGLFVVSRLARRHGIRVHLRPSPYGGTTAVVLIPRELLAEAVDVVPEPTAARTAAESAPAVPVTPVTPAAPPGQRPARAARRVGGPRPAAVEPAATPGGLPRRRTAAEVAAAAPDGTGRHRRADSPAEEQAPPAGVPHAAPAAGPGGLPRRVRQASLAPQLKEAAAERAAAGAGTGTERERERSPEEARATFASFQRGFQRGRGDRLQPASLTVVPTPPGLAPVVDRTFAPPQLRALPSARVPAALPAAPAAPGDRQPPDTPDRPSPQAEPAQPAPAEGTET
ncbi:nitrate- and nitrite sensing domain-containing protein [Kitasatospora camelliae]|uniref:histidine kinase n=1 Tax=Kitasatospora camelliae TaxID=3156397 RepID=A0AAU8K2I7_9ACTN